MSRIAVIVLAAGSSRRFGDLDKLAVPVAGRPLLAWTLEAATDQRIAPGDRTVVIGPGAPSSARTAQMHGWRVVFAHDARRGMGASLRAGLHASGADPDVDGTIVVLGDDPLAACLLGAVLDAAIADPQVPVAIRRTPFLPHPVYLPRASWPTPDEPVDDHGLRSVIRDHARWLEGDGRRPIDVDLPADVARLARALSVGG